ncbi:ferredoxin--NADP reductase [Exilibacterium tricleocarpae]|uniref:ferredoxin--NADP(+) reductase n=1 Tax=Exilibacterium tricleocarpae TaxID=2591008 RepID=A0A545SYW9_9GAMM|nr:ferredoxin--NADP reductase [Exilibacterium tricleocarpae]TQV70166.1 ferredoxin--NADP reductase [Exilibacterium tricleocarpae]
MASLHKETVISVHHWNDTLFSFKTSRNTGLRFENGHFVMVGLELEGKPLMRAYSIASANYDDELEFFSIKVPDGPLTSRLQNVAVGDQILVSSKPTGTLVADHLLPGRHLYLISTGTGLAPFMSIIKDPAIYERYERVVLTHGVRYTSELAYAAYIENELPQNEFFGDEVREKLVYYPTVTREPFRNQGRLTDLLESGELARAAGLPPINPADDRFMICGSPSMLKDTCAILDARGFQESRHGQQAHYVIERAFVER